MCSPIPVTEAQVAQGECKPFGVLSYLNALVGRPTVPDVLPHVQQNRLATRTRALQPRRKLGRVPRRTTRIGIADIEKDCRIPDALTHDLIRRKGNKPSHLVR